MAIATPTNAAVFGADDRLQIAHDPVLSPSGSWTIEAWIATTDDDDQFNRIIRKGVGGGQTYSLLVKDGQAHIRFDGGGAQVVQAGPNIADGLLHHIVGVYDAEEETLTLYVDGFEVGRLDTTGSTPVQGTEPLEIGSISAAPGQFFDGTVHEIRVWDEARSHRDILEAAEGLDPAQEPNLQLQLTFPDGVPEDKSTNQFGVIQANGSIDPASALVVDDDVFTPLDGVSVDFGDPAAGITMTLCFTNLDLTFDLNQPGLFGFPLKIVDGQANGALFTGPEASINAFLASIEVRPVAPGGASLTIEAETTGLADTVTQTITFYASPDPDPLSLVVTTLEDVVDFTDGEISFREALALANSEDDALGDGLPDEITFADDLQGGTINLVTSDGLQITDDLTITGGVTIRGAIFTFATPILDVTSGTVALEGLTIGGPYGLGLRVASGTGVTLRDVEVSNNGSFSRFGGGIRSEGDLTVLDSRVIDNFNGASGAGIYQSGGSLKIQNSEISGGRISTNAGYTAFAGAAGITLTNGATAEISNSLIANNSASRLEGDTGGLKLGAGSSANIVNTTFYGNTSTNFEGFDSVGSIFNDGGTLSLTHVTVTAGEASSVGGILTRGAGSDTIIRNSLLMGNSGNQGAQTDLVGFGPVELQGGNIHSGRLFDDEAEIAVNLLTSQVFHAPANAAGTLTDNGGPLRSVLLLEGGVAHDVPAASPVADATDVDADGDLTEELPLETRGGARVVGTGLDLGALELSQATIGDDIVFSTIANRTVAGESGNDAVEGSSDSDVLSGDAGNDTINAAGGDDRVDGGEGDDRADGGAGEDTLTFASLQDPGFVFGEQVFGVFANLSTQGTAQNTGAGLDTFENFENLEGSRFGDLLTGDGGANTLTGLGGEDVLNGGDGDDLLIGGEGFDAIEGGPGADHLYGGTGGADVEGDIATYFSATGALIFDFGATTSEIQAGSSAEVLEDTIGDDIEGVAGAGSHSNTFLGDELTGLTFFLGGSEGDTFQGGSGVDQLIGLGGDDVMYGNDGGDALLGEGGDDDLFGGAGSDVFFFDGVDGNDTIHDLELGIDLIFFTGGNLVRADVTFADTDADGNGVTDTLLTYEVLTANGLEASSITIIDHDAATVGALAAIIFE